MTSSSQNNSPHDGQKPSAIVPVFQQGPEPVLRSDATVAIPPELARPAGAANQPPQPAPDTTVVIPPQPARPTADETAAIQPRPARPTADETAVIPARPAADETAVIPVQPGPSGTAGRPPTSGDISEVSGEATAPIPASGLAALFGPSAASGSAVPVQPGRSSFGAPPQPSFPPSPQPLPPGDISEMSVPPTPAKKAGLLNKKRIVAVGTVAAVLVAGAGFTAYLYAGDVPRGTTVLGVALGGMSRSEAERALTDAFATKIKEPVAVDLDGERLSVEPAEVALTFQVDRTVGQAMKGGPTLTGERAVEPVVEVDEARLEEKLRAELDPAKVTLKKPAITFSKLTPKVTYPEPGLTLDPAVAADAVRGAWLTGATAAVPLVEQPAATSKEQVDQLVAELAEPAVSGPVTVRAGGKSFELSPAAIAKGLVFRSDDAGQLSPAIDGAKLHKAAADSFAKVETEPTDATVVLTGGKPAVRAGKAGQMVDLTALGTELLTVLRTEGSREVAASLVEKDEEVTEADAAKLGVKEKVSSFTTHFTGGASSPRSQNIMTIAREVDGAIVKPGETFSLNGHTGERSYAQGYQDAPVIVNGVLEPGVGGGASQFTTTLFNASYYAGLQDVEHKPHSFYFDRYPAVIESTIFYPTLDLKFKNTTDYGVLIDTSYTSSSVTVSMWSTKIYDSVQTEYGDKRNVTSPPTQYREPGPDCISSSGLPGFTQDAWRVIRKDGKEVERKKFTWRYDPEPRFVCGAEPQ